MFKLLAKVVRKGHTLRQALIEDGSEDTRTHKVRRAVNEACMELDLAEPIWLPLNIRDFKQRGKCRFTQDSFVEEIDFDYLGIEMVEEDDSFLWGV